jgi:hypothetical protein
MATFIKAGFWEQLCKPCRGYKGWLNLDQLITSLLPVPAYRVYTALLTQSGGDDPQSITSGVLTKGVTYYGLEPNPGDVWDFSNVGGPKYPDDFQFVATQTAEPIAWGNREMVYNTGAPVVTVLENTIGNVWFNYGAAGVYIVNCSDVSFNQNTYMIVGNPTWDGGIGYIQSGFDGNIGLIATHPDFLTDSTNCGLLLNTPIEIRVYS